MSSKRHTRTLIAFAVVLLVCAALTPAASAKSGRRVVVLVSGVAATTPYTTPTKACGTGYPAGNTWSYVRDYLTQRGYEVYTAPASMGGQQVVETTDTYAGPFADCPKQLPARMTINNIGSVDRSASSVARFIQYLHDKHGVTSADVVGHSLGGIIGRAAIREVRFNHVPVRIRSYTTLGSPWDGVMLAAPLVPGKPLSACDGLAVCEGFLKSLLPIPGINILVSNIAPVNMPTWNATQAGALDGIPVTVVGGSYFTKPGGIASKWPNDGAIQLRSALATETTDAVIPHRACFTFPLTHSIFVSHDINAPEDTALTWNADVAAVVAHAIDNSGQALSQPNRVGCQPKPKG
jgi:pimeloyl-ACP methyl ester carboxylesterase